MPPNTVSVARPGRWGKAYSLEEFCYDALRLFAETARCVWSATLGKHLSAEKARRAYELHNAWQQRLGPCHPIEAARSELRWRNLACWCLIPAAGERDACHAAILLEIANS